MKNIHIIPTDKTSVLILRQDGKLFFTGYGSNSVPTTTEIINAINEKLESLYQFGLNYYFAGNTLIVSNSTCYDDFTNKTLYLNIGVDIQINCDQQTPTITPTITPVCECLLISAATEACGIYTMYLNQSSVIDGKFSFIGIEPDCGNDGQQWLIKYNSGNTRWEAYYRDDIASILSSTSDFPNGTWSNIYDSTVLYTSSCSVCPEPEPICGCYKIDNSDPEILNLTGTYADCDGETQQWEITNGSRIFVCTSDSESIVTDDGPISVRYHSDCNNCGIG